MANKMLYPKNTKTRSLIDLSGMWKFKFDYDNNGELNNYQNELYNAMLIPVPSTFNDLFVEKEKREYAGSFWYQTNFYLDESYKDKDIDIRFYGSSHKITVYLNGKKIHYHNRGFSPFSININDYIYFDKENILSVKINNELDQTTLPCGETIYLSNGKKLVKPYFDFFNYSGLIRPVKLVITPKISILDITLNHKINGNNTSTDYILEINRNDILAKVKIYDINNNLVESKEGIKNSLNIKNTKLWSPKSPYLYKFVFSLFKDNKLIDEYNLDVGIREIKIKDNKFMLNNDPIYFKGFGKHEDFYISGRATNLPVATRDFNLLKWVNANSFRTSHYPYSEEILMQADREGILIIDECSAVGMMKSLMNALDASNLNKKNISYFSQDIVYKETLANHLDAVKELINRDKNYASVIAFSLFNEPETTDSSAIDYFEKVFNYAKTLDVQNRPLSFAMLLTSTPDKCNCYHLCDFIMLNRYYGWYINGGIEISDAMLKLDHELDIWDKINKPVIFSEYGADTVAGIHRLPPVMFSEEYQIEFLRENHKIFDKHKCVVGENIWNFADFETSEGIIRVNGNKKGVFSRDREPKMAAFYLKDRWSNINDDFKN